MTIYVKAKAIENSNNRNVAGVEDIRNRVLIVKDGRQRHEKTSCSVCNKPFSAHDHNWVLIDGTWTHRSCHSNEGR